MNTYAWILVVFVVADGEWRDWKSFGRFEECHEVIQVITHRRETAIQAKCEYRLINQ